MLDKKCSKLLFFSWHYFYYYGYYGKEYCDELLLDV